MTQHVQVTTAQFQQLLDCIDHAAANRETALEILRTVYTDDHPEVQRIQAELDQFYQLAAHLVLHNTATPKTHR